jgi:WD40 repeat protein
MLALLLASITWGVAPAGARAAADAKPGPPQAPALKLSPGLVIDTTTLVPIKPGGEKFASGLRIDCVAFSPDGKSVATHTERDGRLWSVATGKPITPPIRAGFMAQSVTFRADGKAVLFFGHFCMQVYDSATGKPFFDLSDPKVLPGLLRSKKGEYFNGVSAAAFGRTVLLAAGHGAGTNAVLFNAKGRPLGELLRQPADVRAVALDPTGRFGACSVLRDIKGEVVLSRVPGLEQLAVLPHDNEVYALAFSPDGNLLLTVSGRIRTGGVRHEGVIRAWATRTGKQVGGPWAHQGSLKHLAFRPDGKEVLAVVQEKPGAHGTLTRKAVTWDVATGKVRHVFAHPEGSWVAVAAWSPDGKRVFTAGGRNASGNAPRGSLRAWDAATGRALKAAEHPTEVRSLAVSADGRRLVTGGLDGKARVWEVEDVRPAD